MLTGRAFKFGDDISTDHIIPGRYAHLRSNLPVLAAHVMEDADPTFADRVKPGDFIVAGSNFGLGSSREHAPLVIKMAGVEDAWGFTKGHTKTTINYSIAAFEALRTTSQVRVTGEQKERLNIVSGPTRIHAAPSPYVVEESAEEEPPAEQKPPADQKEGS